MTLTEKIVELLIRVADQTLAYYLAYTLNI